MRIHSEFLDALPSDVLNLIEKGHAKDEAAKGVYCGYKKFAIILRAHDGSFIGALQAYTAFAEIYIDDIWVSPDYRCRGLGRKMLTLLEKRFQNKGYNNINLVTSDFQAPDFYKRCGYAVEFVRVNQQNPHLTKTFFVKYFDDDKQFQGLLEKGS